MCIFISHNYIIMTNPPHTVKYAGNLKLRHFQFHNQPTPDSPTVMFLELLVYEYLPEDSLFFGFLLIIHRGFASAGGAGG